MDNVTYAGGVKLYRLYNKQSLEHLHSEIPPPPPPTHTHTHTHTQHPMIMITHTIIHTRSHVKTIQSQIYKFKTIAKNPKFEILHKTLHATHLLQLPNKMHKYEMDPTRTVSATEQTRHAGQTDGRTDRQTEWNQYNTPNNFAVQRV